MIENNGGHFLSLVTAKRLASESNDNDDEDDDDDDSESDDDSPLTPIVH